MQNRLIVCAAVLSLAIGCGKSSSPTAPTATPANATRVIALEGSLNFGDVIVGQSRDTTITIRNTGTGPMALSGITASGGLTTQSTASPTTGSIQANGSLPILFRFTPTSAGAFSGTVTFTTDHTSGTNTISMSGAGVGAPVTVTGVVTDAVTRRAVGGVRVAALRNDASVQLLAETTTDGNGFYSFVVPSATTISMGYSRAGYNVQSSAVTFTADTRRDIAINPFWTASGIGNTVFDMPTYVSRVRITGRYDSSSSNFVVRIGGRLIVNELLGRSWSSTTYNGLHLVSGGVTEITISRDVTWTFTQEQ